MTVSTGLAAAFRALHVPGEPLVLVNAWDAASARIVEAAGAPAVATTSAGVAWSLGVPDGAALDRDQALEAVARIVRAVRVPVTADIEDGFGEDPAGVASTVERLRAVGAVGANIEDARGASSSMSRTRRSGWRRPTRPVAPTSSSTRGSTPTCWPRGIRPAGWTRPCAGPQRSWRQAPTGSSVPGTADTAVIAELVAGIDAPLNISAKPGGPTSQELAALGAARTSTGAATALTAYGVLRRALAGIDDSDAQVGGVSHDELNALLSPR